MLRTAFVPEDKAIWSCQEPMNTNKRIPTKELYPYVEYKLTENKLTEFTNQHLVSVPEDG